MSNVAAMIAALNKKTTIQRAVQPPPPPARVQPPPPPVRLQPLTTQTHLQPPPPPPHTTTHVQPLKVALLIASEKMEGREGSNASVRSGVKSKILPGRGPSALFAATRNLHKGVQPLCKFFQQGRCVNGANCKFKHR